MLCAVQSSKEFMAGFAVYAVIEVTPTVICC